MYVLTDDWGFNIFEGTLVQVYSKYKELKEQGKKGMEIYRGFRRIF